MNGRSEAVSYLDWAVRGRSGIVRYLVAIAVAVAFLLVVQGIAILFLERLASDESTTFLVKNLSFAATFLAILASVRVLLGRPSWSVAVPRLPGPVADLLAGFAIMVVAQGVKTLVMTPFVPVESNASDRWADPAVIAPYLLLAVPVFLLQTSTEELLFRGLIGQFLRRLTPHAWVIIGGTAVAFALPHATNLANADGGPLALVPYFVSGLLFGFAAWRSGSLWLPIGLHFGNNLFLATLVGMDVDAGPKQNILFLIDPSLPMIAAMAVGLNAVVGVVVHVMYRNRPTRAGG